MLKMPCTTLMVRDCWAESLRYSMQRVTGKVELERTHKCVFSKFFFILIAPNQMRSKDSGGNSHSGSRYWYSITAC